MATKGDEVREDAIDHRVSKARMIWSDGGIDPGYRGAIVRAGPSFSPDIEAELITPIPRCS